jgi:hypothetical protein
VDVPVEEPIALIRVRQLATTFLKVSRHQWDRVRAAEHVGMVETEPSRDRVEECVDALLGTGDAVLNHRRIGVGECGEVGVAGGHRGDAAQEPLELEVVPGLSPRPKPFAKLMTCFRPRGANLGEGKIALRELGAAAVDPVEDVDHDIDSHVLTTYLLGMEIDVSDALQPVQPADRGHEFHPDFRQTIFERFKEVREIVGLHHLGDIDPERVVAHPDRRVELEGFVCQIEM